MEKQIAKTKKKGFYFATGLVVQENTKRSTRTHTQKNTKQEDTEERPSSGGTHTGSQTHVQASSTLYVHYIKTRAHAATMQLQTLHPSLSLYILCLNLLAVRFAKS